MSSDLTAVEHKPWWEGARGEWLDTVAVSERQHQAHPDGCLRAGPPPNVQHGLLD